MSIRIGSGYDVHRLVPGRRLVLGGVVIAHGKGLLGHSDADALIHAVCDALLGAAGLGDIGRHFPDTDPAFKDIDSRTLLDSTCGLIRAAGHEIGNIDATILAQAPRLSGHMERMRANLAETMKIDPGRINIKATTTEGLGAIGRGEGIGAMCSALLMETKMETKDA